MKKAKSAEKSVEPYRHPEAKLITRPEVGTLPQFKKKKEPATYRYDSSLAPELVWDGENSAREMGEWLIGCVQEAAKLPSPHRHQRIPDPLRFLGSQFHQVVSECG
jgi:adenine-specific DNA-methyltransferase